MTKIDIIENYEEWIVVNKPAGLSVHNPEDKTNLLKELKEQGFLDFHAVNRLDKETSGIMVLSKNSKVTAELQKTLEHESTSKTYLAILRGAFKEDKLTGTWNDAITNKAEGRKNALGVKAQRVNAVTHYEVLNSNKFLSYVRLTIDTGRQHQIRKHALVHKHEILGDKRYGDKKYNLLIAKQYDIESMTLHAHKLSFKFEDVRYKFSSNAPEDWSLFDLGI
jgi:tRNA pseudouridine65 synthase